MMTQMSLRRMLKSWNCLQNNHYENAVYTHNLFCVRLVSVGRAIGTAIAILGSSVNTAVIAVAWIAGKCIIIFCVA